MSQILFILRGLPASGKSTFAKQWVRERPAERARLNRDDIRLSLFNRTVLEGFEEKIVTDIENATLHALLKAGKSVVIDNQNTRAKNVKGYIAIAEAYGVPVTHKDFEVELPELLRRNAARERQVDSAYIEKVYKNFTRKGAFTAFPSLAQVQADVAAGKYVADEQLPPAWIVDMDGTLARLIEGGRSPYDFTRVLEDEVNEHVARLVRLVHANGSKILITSGRSDIARADTETWLQANDIPYDAVFMRQDGDQRRDSIVKRELFDAHIRHHYNVQGVLDDRLQVAELWHGMGLPLFRVGDPTANF